jgi:hypothetical protein
MLTRRSITQFLQISYEREIVSHNIKFKTIPRRRNHRLAAGSWSLEIALIFIKTEKRAKGGVKELSSHGLPLALEIRVFAPLSSILLVHESTRLKSRRQFNETISPVRNPEQRTDAAPEREGPCAIRENIV